VDMEILPVGSTEPQVPNLAMATDTLSATLVAEAGSARTGVAVLPPIPYGCSLGHSHRWPGTLALGPETLIGLVVDVLSWTYAAGFRPFLVLHAHPHKPTPV